MARTVKHRKNVRARIEQEIIERATADECEQAATLAYAQSEIAKSNTTKTHFDLLAAFANRQAAALREIPPAHLVPVVAFTDDKKAAL